MKSSRCFFVVKVKKEIVYDKKLEDYLKQKKDNKKEENLKITWKQKEKLYEILKKIKINIEKGSYEVAKSLIIEWLTIDKFNRDLNLELAFLYEKEKSYKNSEFIYKDLLTYYKNDLKIRKKLWFNLAVQNKLKQSFEVYEMTFKKNRNDLEVIEMLVDISYDMKKYQKCLKYVNLFLKNKWKNIEKLFIKAKCLEQIEKMKEAAEIYNKILTFQPYDTEAKNKLKELEKFI